MLTLPWPFAEIAPLATTRRAISVTWPARSLSTAHPLACRGQRIPACRPGTRLLLQPDLVAADEVRVTGEGRVDQRVDHPVPVLGVRRAPVAGRAGPRVPGREVQRHARAVQRAERLVKRQPRVLVPAQGAHAGRRPGPAG